MIQWSTILGFIRGTALLGFALCVGLSLWLVQRHYAENSQPFTHQIYHPDARLGQADYLAIGASQSDGTISNRAPKLAELDFGVVLRAPADCCVYRDATSTAEVYWSLDLPPGVVSLSPENGAWTAFMKIEPIPDAETDSLFGDAPDPKSRVIQPPTHGRAGTHRSIEWILESTSGKQAFRNHFIQIDEKGRRLNAVLVATASEFDRAMQQFRTVLGDVTLKPPTWFEREFYLDAQNAQSRLVWQAILFFLIALIIPGKSRIVHRYKVIRVRDKTEGHQRAVRSLFPLQNIAPTPAMAFANGASSVSQPSPAPQPNKARPSAFRRSTYFNPSIPPALVPRIPLSEILKTRKQIDAPLRVAQGLQIKRLSHALPDSVPGNVPLMPTVLYVGVGGAGINTLQHAMSIDMPNMGHAVMDSQSFNDKAITELLKDEGPQHYTFSSKSLRHSNAWIRVPVFNIRRLAGEHREIDVSLRQSQELAMDEMLEGVSLLMLAASAGSRAAEDALPSLIRKAIHHDIPTLAIVSVPFSVEPYREQITDANLSTLALYGIPYIRFDNTRIPEVLGEGAGMFESICAQTDWINLLAWSVTHLHQQGKLQPILETRGEITFSHAEHTGHESLATLIIHAIKNQQLVETGWEGRKALIVVVSSTPPSDRTFKKAVQKASKETFLPNPAWAHIQDERLGEHKYAIVLGYRGQ